VALAALLGAERAFGDQVVLDGVHVELQPGDRVALVGRNGAGKSTLLRALAGLDPLDAGERLLAAETVVGYLDQDDSTIDPRHTVLAIADAAFAGVERLEGELQALAEAGLEDPFRYEHWLDAYARFERRGGPSRRARRDALLHAFSLSDYRDRAFGSLSGGERTRFRLARLLMQQPDVLLLDEPTNHLDLAMRDVLAGLLARYPGAVVVVSHDRALLDDACSRTIEVEHGKVFESAANPTGHQLLRLEQRRIQARTHANEQRERDRLETAATRMKRWAGQNEKLHRRARAMERRLERFEAAMVEAPAHEGRSLRFRFDCDESADTVLHAAHLTAAYDRRLFTDASVHIRQGERVAIVGRNGAGKTTLLRMLLGELGSSDPRAFVRWGARVRVGVLDQHLAGFNPDERLLDVLVRRLGEGDAHNALGRFMFPYEAQFKSMGQLSGGERMRLGLLNLTLEQANMLVLDEPTNHLDAEMIEALEDALLAYQGTILLVSHDRRLLERVATRVLEVSDGRLVDHERDFAGYLRRRQEDAAAVDRRSRDPVRVAPQPVTEVAAGGRSRWQLQRDLEKLEATIATLEAKLASLIHALAQATDVGDVQALARAGADHTHVDAALLEALAEWERTSSELAAAGGG
jgi:ATP-binding cassette subfamily F protein 3